MAVDQTQVSLLLSLKDQVSAGLNRIGDGLKRVSGGTTSAQTAFQGFGLSSAVSVAAIGTAVYKTIDAVRALADQGIDLNKAFENTSIRIAGTLKAFDVAPTFARAKAQAADVMGTVAELAAKLPGETEDYVSVFATALPKAIAAGMTDMQEVAKFTSYWTAVATSNMVDAQQAGMDLFRILSGQAGADVRMWTVLSEKIGMTTEAFNKLAAPERLAKIQDAIGAFDAQLIAAGDTFEAKAGEFESRLKEIKRVGSELTFAMAKQSLDEMNDRLKTNRAELVATTETLTGTYTWLSESTKSVLTDLGVIAAKMLNTFVLTNAELAKIRGAEAPADTAADRTAAIAKEQMRAEAARQARIDVYKEQRFEEIEQQLPERMQRGLGPSGLATPKVYEELIRIGKARKDDIVFVNKLTEYAEFMRAGDPELLYYKITGRKTQPEKKTRVPAEERVGLQKPKPLRTSEAPVTNFYNSRFDIKQNFAEGFDPDRVAVAFAADLGRAGEMKTQSSYNQAYTTR